MRRNPQLLLLASILIGTLVFYMPALATRLARNLAARSLQVQQAQNVTDIQRGEAKCSDIITCFWLGKALNELGRNDEAIALWRGLPNTDLYFAFQGDLAYKQGSISDALQLYDISWRISNTPAEGKVTMLLNRCRERRSEWGTEHKVYWCEQAVAAKRNYWTLLELGRAYYETQQYPLAEQILQEAIRSSPNPSAAYYWLGLTLSKSGRRAEGLDALYTSVRLDPKNIWARLDLANNLTSERSYLRAACEYLKALDLTDQIELRQTIQDRMALLPVAAVELRQCDQ